MFNTWAKNSNINRGTLPHWKSPIPPTAITFLTRIVKYKAKLFLLTVFLLLKCVFSYFQVNP